MVRVLVTGSEGFIGNALANALVASNHDVVGMDVCEPWSRAGYSEYVQGDIRKFSDVERAAREVEVVFHFAAISNLNIAREKALETIITNVMGTANVLEASRKQHMKVIFASSEQVYGSLRTKLVSEATTPRPREIYAASKLAAEQIINTFGVRNTILRLSSVYGPHMRKELAIFLFLSKALKGEDISIHLPGKQTRQYAYIDDIVEASILAMSQEADGHTINIPGPEGISVLELATMCVKLAHSNSKLTFLPPRANDVDCKPISYEKARRVLGWTPKLKMAEGLTRTLEWITTSMRDEPVLTGKPLISNSPARD